MYANSLTYHHFLCFTYYNPQDLYLNQEILKMVLDREHINIEYKRT